MEDDSWFEIYKNGLKNIFTINERMTRREYIVFHLMIFLVSFSIALLPLLIGTSTILLVLLNVFVLYQCIAAFTSMFRRFYDMNRTRWWLLFLLVPIIGPLWIMIWTCVAKSE